MISAWWLLPAFWGGGTLGYLIGAAIMLSRHAEIKPVEVMEREP